MIFNQKSSMERIKAEEPKVESIEVKEIKNNMDVLQNTVQNLN